MPYLRFGAMILTSTVVMFVLMYLNTYALEHVFFSETRVYMAVLMGACMAFIMLAFMLGMYRNSALNLAIFTGAIVAFGLSLWLVRSQATVSGPSYMRAMIPHHSIAVLTSERAKIRDARVRRLADEIIAAQRKEIAEMRYLIADVSAGNVVREVYEDPPVKVGTVGDARNSGLLAALDPAPLTQGEAEKLLHVGEHCRFARSLETNPILWADPDGANAAVKLNGVIIPLRSAGDTGELSFEADGLEIRLKMLGDDADWRSNAELTFAVEPGPHSGYRGFFSCG